MPPSGEVASGLRERRLRGRSSRAVAFQPLEPSRDFFDRIPATPGVYLMKDRAGRVVYVGKAVNLRSRVRQYFRPGDDARYFVAAGLLGRVLADIETVVVDTEREALLLENHLIKKHQPRFNVKLRDDKQYLVLRIDPSTRFPRVEVVRNIRDDSARYFGPFHSASSCRETLRTVNRHFQLRTCTDHVLNNRTRPCLQYQIKRCPGPCVYPIDEEEYRQQVDEVMLFLRGKKDELISRLSDRMQERAGEERFEAAAQLRDSIRAVERTLSSQRVVQEDFVDQDVFGLWREGDVADAVVLFVRAGKLVGRRSFRERDQEFSDGEVMANIVQQYYASGTFVPDEVLVPVVMEAKEQAVIADWLSATRGKKVRIATPQRGPRRKLVELANKNAAAVSASESRSGDADAALQKLQERLHLSRFPARVECYDIAHVQGTETVGARVVFQGGTPDRAHYRKFKVRSATNDDFAAMYEVLTRRLKRALGHNGAGDDSSWALPDLLVVDGGKGQLGSALAALADLGIPVGGEGGTDVIALAKERRDQGRPERVFLPNVKDAIALRPNSSELFVLARLRDEAHRFANTFHRARRKRSAIRSALGDIPGIGAARQKALLRHFGSVKAVREASLEELCRAEGMTRPAAEAIRRHFDDEGLPPST
jgi:excinuclease ABC subunit C